MGVRATSRRNPLDNQTDARHAPDVPGRTNTTHTRTRCADTPIIIII